MGTRSRNQQGTWGEEHDKDERSPAGMSLGSLGASLLNRIMNTDLEPSTTSVVLASDQQEEYTSASASALTLSPCSSLCKAIGGISKTLGTHGVLDVSLASLEGLWTPFGSVLGQGNRQCLEVELC